MGLSAGFLQTGFGLASEVLKLSGTDLRLFNLFSSFLIAAAALTAYSIFVRYSEGTWPSAIPLSRAAFETTGGLLFGISLSATCVGLLYVFGLYQVVRVAEVSSWGYLILAALPLPIVSGVVEELLFRGVILRQLARSFSPWIALALSALLFGLLHAANPNASLSAGFGLAIQAGLLLGVAYLVTGRLWFAIGLHAAWNFMQTAVVGGAISGNTVRAIITSAPSGPIWLSGGAFGIEGSAVTTTICLLAAIGILAKFGFKLPQPD